MKIQKKGMKQINKLKNLERINVSLYLKKRISWTNKLILNNKYLEYFLNLHRNEFLTRRI